MCTLFPAWAMRRTVRRSDRGSKGWVMSDGEAEPGRVPVVPGSRAGIPQFVQVTVLAAIIHRVPEAVVLEGGQLAVAGELYQRLLLQYQVGRFVQAVEKAAVEDEETAVDPAAGEER